MFDAIVLGSGAAGLNAALQLSLRGVRSVALVSEGLQMGTSINTGSDKQTYYKIGMSGKNPDSNYLMAQSLYDGFSMHGDIALVEASLSARAFLNLHSLGIRFPSDPYGQFAAYKTDHDPVGRASSVGPYTSREICRFLIEELKRREVKIFEGRLAVALLTLDENEKKRSAGLLALNMSETASGGKKLKFETFISKDLVFAVGGPGGLYKRSVYPHVHTGSIGLALMAGAGAQNLCESQFGMASTKFRWNVSGSYMQAVPSFLSVGKDGGDRREFLLDYFKSPERVCDMTFLKGYQWPFDSRKIPAGSSMIDILVHVETEIKGRRVFLDFKSNPHGFDAAKISDEARSYLMKSGALASSPVERLMAINPAAISLYMEHGINLFQDELGIAVCAQHNNGGLSGDTWWESPDLSHFYPVGEVNGSHGVYRPGGAALNAGQVGAFRAAEHISRKDNTSAFNADLALKIASDKIQELREWIAKSRNRRDWRSERSEFQDRMSSHAAHIRSESGLCAARDAAWEQFRRIKLEGHAIESEEDAAESLRNIQLCFAHAVYLDAISFAVESGVGSRGSAIVLSEKDGDQIDADLLKEWRIQNCNPLFLEQVLETKFSDGSAQIRHGWVPRRPIPESDLWFETLLKSISANVQ